MKMLYNLYPFHTHEAYYRMKLIYGTDNLLVSEYLVDAQRDYSIVETLFLSDFSDELASLILFYEECL